MSGHAGFCDDEGRDPSPSDDGPRPDGAHPDGTDVCRSAVRRVAGAGLHLVATASEAGARLTADGAHLWTVDELGLLRTELDLVVADLRDELTRRRGGHRAG